MRRGVAVWEARVCDGCDRVWSLLLDTLLMILYVYTYDINIFIALGRPVRNAIAPPPPPSPPSLFFSCFVFGSFHTGLSSVTSFVSKG